MKRLMYYLNQITDANTTTFRYTTTADGSAVQKEIYDGECEVIYLKPNGELARSTDRTYIRREPTFWQNGIAYTFDRSSRLTLDKPIVTVSIPLSQLNILKRTTAAADFCLREIKPYFDAVNDEYANKARPDSDNGKFYVHAPGGEVLVRNAAYFTKLSAKDYTEGKRNIIYFCEFTAPPPDEDCLCIRMEIQLPHGKLKRTKKMLLHHLPTETERFVRHFNHKGLTAALDLEKKQIAIRKFLKENNYCAFIANGSILPREKETDRPMKNALPFQSPPDDEIGIEGIKGMGIKNGVTVITGGGYSGKSTVLNALSAGIYNHTSGDGRELCLVNDSAVSITAEDGRAVSMLNISPFIKWIAEGDTRIFSTVRASGSTSQAANIMEAVEAGSQLLLIDEDRSATNFMICDERMRKLIKKEPITPFTDRVQELAGLGISTVLVIGGSGEYLNVADKVYGMDDFIISDITEEAKMIGKPTASVPTENISGTDASPVGKPTASVLTAFVSTASLEKADWETKRMLLSGGFTPYPNGSGTEKLAVSDTGFIIIGDERIDMRNLHDIATPAQTNTLAFMLLYLMRGARDGNDLEQMAQAMRGLPKSGTGRVLDIDKSITNLYAEIEINGLNIVDTGFFTDLNRFMELPRPYELRAVINRMRGVEWQHHSSTM